MIILQNYVHNKHGLVFQGSSILKSINQRIKLENKINKLENTIDSLNASMLIKSDEKIIDGSPSNFLVSEMQNDYSKIYFISLDEAVKIRNEKGHNSYIAQKYINLAYEMGGDDWYGAEEIWDTAKFQEKLVTLNLNK
tara:strand:+ start:333 stop:746 length:414 start_codon:yes stop_codon:yes gene_type:complete